MCMLSFIGDSAGQWTQPAIQRITYSEVSRAEFEELKRKVEVLHKLLLAAKTYDEETGQPDCETDEKVAHLRKLADLLGVDMEDVFG